MGPRGTDGGSLLCRHQPFDGGRLYRGLRAQSAARRTQIAWDIRRASRTAQPNARIVTIADRLLERDGRMVHAIETIGPGDLAIEGHPFRLDIG